MNFPILISRYITKNPSNITFSIVPGRHEHDRDRGGIPGHVAPGPAGHTRGGIREFLFRRKKKETTGTMKFLTISQLMGKSKNPLVMGVYPVVGDVFMMLGMALVCAKRARLCPEKFENTLSSIFLIADSNVASSSSSYPGVRVLLCARHRVRVRLRLSLLLRQGRGGKKALLCSRAASIPMSCMSCLFQWACTSQGYPTDLQTILMLSSRYYTSRQLKFASRFTLPTNLIRPVAILLLWWQLCGAQHCRHPGRRVWLPSHCLTLLHHLQLHGPTQHCHPSPKRAADCQEEGQSLHYLNTAIGMSCNVPSPPNSNKKKSQ